jgi:hypothetical protein
MCGVDKPEPKQWVTGLYKAVTKRSQNGPKRHDEPPT